MKKLCKGTVIGLLALGIALGTAVQANAMPGYTEENHPYGDSCKSCHATNPYGTPSDNNGGTTTPSDNNGGTTTPDNNGQTPSDNNGNTTPSDNNSGAATTTPSSTPVAVLPQTGVEGMYLNYLAGAGLLIPGAALLVSRKKRH